MQVINLLGTDWSVVELKIEQTIGDGCCLYNCSDTSPLNVWKYSMAS